MIANNRRDRGRMKEDLIATPSKRPNRVPTVGLGITLERHKRKMARRAGVQRKYRAQDKNGRNT